ncbi:hypothetical protein CEXT_705021, partial [Caerostris extrusa]
NAAGIHRQLSLRLFSDHDLDLFLIQGRLLQPGIELSTTSRSIGTLSLISATLRAGAGLVSLAVKNALVHYQDSTPTLTLRKPLLFSHGGSFFQEHPAQPPSLPLNANLKRSNLKYTNLAALLIGTIITLTCSEPNFKLTTINNEERTRG